jgi:hypothetical protein
MEVNAARTLVDTALTNLVLCMKVFPTGFEVSPIQQSAYLEI